MAFRNDHWTSAQARHKSMPTTQNHWTRSQMRHGSVLTVRARPIPEESFSGHNDDFPVEVFIRHKKLVAAWRLMKSCDIGLWADVCDLYALIVAVEQNPGKFENCTQVLNEVAEAKLLMQNAELLRAVETIEAYNEEEWTQEPSPACVRRGSLMVMHKHRDDDETRLESKVRHVENANAWELMKSCDKDTWAAVCHYHEEECKLEKGKRQMSLRQEQAEERKIPSGDLNHRKVAQLSTHKSIKRNGTWNHAA